MDAVKLVAWDLAGVLCDFDTDHRLEEMGKATGLAPEEVERRVWGAGIDSADDRGEFAGTAQLRDALETDLDVARLDPALAERGL